MKKKKKTCSVPFSNFLNDTTLKDFFPWFKWLCTCYTNDMILKEHCFVGIFVGCCRCYIGMNGSTHGKFQLRGWYSEWQYFGRTNQQLPS